MVRTLDTDRYSSGRASGTAGKNARRTTAQRTRGRQTAAGRTTSQKTTSRQTTAQRTRARTAATQGTTAQRTRAQGTAATQGTTVRRTRAQGTAAQARTAQTTRAPKTRVQAGTAQTARAPKATVQTRAVKRAVKAEIEPAGRGVRVDVDGYNAAGGEMRVPRSAMSFQTVIVMLALIAVMTVILVFYITLQSEVTATSQLIADKEQELTQLKAENDASYNDINDSISLEEVRRRAIQDLGMKYADRDQVVIYTGTEKDSVHQVSSLNDN